MNIASNEIGLFEGVRKATAIFSALILVLFHY